MSDLPEALRLAQELQRDVGQIDDDDQVVLVPRWTVEGAIEELRRQHSRIEADEALMRQAVDALTETYNASAFPVGSLLLRGESITALRKRLESSNG